MDEEDFVKEFGWTKINGIKVEHQGFNNDWEHSYWDNESLSDFITNCIFWQDESSDRACEDIEEVIEYIEDENNITYDKWIKQKINNVD